MCWGLRDTGDNTREAFATTLAPSLGCSVPLAPSPEGFLGAQFTPLIVHVFQGDLRPVAVLLPEFCSGA